MSISENVGMIRAKIETAAKRVGKVPKDITLVAASKTMPASAVREAIEAGVEVIGENRVQEMLEKLESDAYKGAKLHFIGHLQKNKVKYVVGNVDLIQSVDSLELLKLINETAEKKNVIQDVLVEINIGREDSKHGIDPDELREFLLESEKFSSVKVKGLMAIPPASAQDRTFFKAMRELFVDIRDKKYDNKYDMQYLSMGMSDDFCDAIEEGANMVRIGTSIFGRR